MQVVTVPDANSYTVTFTSAATSTVSGGGGSSVTANYSKFYSIWKYSTGGWTTISSNRSSVGVTKVRHSMSAYSDTEDVIITDGFTGNIALKTAEGTANFIMKEVKNSMTSNLYGKVLSFLNVKNIKTVSYTHLRAHETKANLVCRLLL